VSTLFHEIQNRYEKLITVRVSYIEIYNEMLNDLLSSNQDNELNQNLAIQEDPHHGVYVKGSMMPEVLRFDLVSYGRRGFRLSVRR
jgi:hypothetical protein